MGTGEGGFSDEISSFLATTRAAVVLRIGVGSMVDIRRNNSQLPLLSMNSNRRLTNGCGEQLGSDNKSC